MLTRLRSTWLAGGGALLLALSVTGFVAGATLVADTDTLTGAAEPVLETPDTTLTFEDVDGDGVDDDCDDAVAADQIAADAANAAVDANADGVVSVPEAAHSDRVGGPNCNHGGYVSMVAHASGDTCDDPDADEDAAQDAADGTANQEANEDQDEDADAGDEDAADGADESDPDADADESDEAETPTDESADACAEETDETDEDADETAPEPAVCETSVEEPTPEEEAPTDTAPNAHGKAVSEVAKSDAVGGKNCNHGGAVSEAAKKDHGAKQAHLHGKSAGKGHGKGHNKP